jgi:hypothetical protein
MVDRAGSLPRWRTVAVDTPILPPAGGVPAYGSVCSDDAAEAGYSNPYAGSAHPADTSSSSATAGGVLAGGVVDRPHVRSAAAAASSVEASSGSGSGGDELADLAPVLPKMQFGDECWPLPSGPALRDVGLTIGAADLFGSEPPGQAAAETLAAALGRGSRPSNWPHVGVGVGVGVAGAEAGGAATGAAPQPPPRAAGGAATAPPPHSLQDAASQFLAASGNPSASVSPSAVVVAEATAAEELSRLALVATRGVSARTHAPAPRRRCRPAAAPPRPQRPPGGARVRAATVCLSVITVAAAPS